MKKSNFIADLMAPLLYSAPYTQKIRTYASQSKELFLLSDFISKHAELQAFSELGKTTVKPLLVNTSL